MHYWYSNKEKDGAFWEGEIFQSVLVPLSITFLSPIRPFAFSGHATTPTNMTMMFRNGKNRLTLEGIVSSLNVKTSKNDSQYKIKRKCMWNWYWRASTQILGKYPIFRCWPFLTYFEVNNWNFAILLSTCSFHFLIPFCHCWSI